MRCPPVLLPEAAGEDAGGPSACYMTAVGGAGSSGFPAFDSGT